MTMNSIAERRARGLTLQAEVTGQPAPSPATPVEESLRDFVFAEVWNRPGLERRARYLISIAGSAMSGSAEMLDRMVTGALASGLINLSELREAALHMAVYGGWGRAEMIDAAVTRAASALALPAAACPPIRAADWDPEQRTAEGMAAFTKVMTFPGGPSISPFLEAINNFVFGEMWCRAGLDERSRRFMTLVAVADSSAETPIKSHFHAAMASGNCTAAELHEFVLQYGLQAGWPKASLVQGIVFEMAKKVEAGLAWNG